MADNFTWVETYKNIATKLRSFRENQKELLSFLSDLKARHFPTIPIMDKDENGNRIPLLEIDPFTFFAYFNRGLKTENRIEIIRLLAERWKLSCPIPSGFSGIPVVNNQQTWFIAYKKDRGKKDVSLLWDLFEQALDDKIKGQTFDAVLGLKYIRYNITMGLFWISPDKYLNLDRVNRAYLEKNGIRINRLPDYATYVEYMNSTRNVLKKPFFQISHDAWLDSTKPGPAEKATDDGIQKTDTTSYWWLNANPRIWDMVASSIGTKHIYTSHNTNGNKRRIYQYFKQVKPGDLLLGYVASPVRQVTALCKVTKGLHNSPEGEGFEFEKVEQFREPVGFKQLQSAPELAECEPLMNNQGSLFRLSLKEYEAIRSIIDEQYDMVAFPSRKAEKYTIEQCTEDTGFPPSQIKKWKSAIERKKQAVFYGPPGTGKTFIADHLARYIVGNTSGFVELIQFHPAYAYEEFMQGIRPVTDEKGSLFFELTPGRFLSFCKNAKQCEGPCVLIIDEINRANLSRVFGELMYLLEYRDKEIPLAGGEPFSIPSNVLIIGTMNTADRSIALVDFALRRRFAFIELLPEYDVLLNFQKKRGFDATGLVKLLKEVNTKINDKNFSLGISFFMHDNLAGMIEHIWKMEIETYLEEYFFSQPEAVSSFRWAKINERVLS